MIRKGYGKRSLAIVIVWFGVIVSTYWITKGENFFWGLLPVQLLGLIFCYIILNKPKKGEQ